MGGSGWSELPDDLLETIEGHLGMYDDEIRFRCVCTHFRQSVSDDLPDLRQPQTPWLLLPYKTGSMCGLYNPLGLENKVLDIDLPEAGEKIFRGTGHGWVVTQQLNGSIDVLNPLTRVRVPLPPRYRFPDVAQYNPDNIGVEYIFKDYRPRPGPPRPVYHISSMEVRNSTRMEKVVLSSSPLSEDFIAVAVFASTKLAYCKVGDTEWHSVELDEELDGRGFKDVTFFGGKLYAVSWPAGELMICDDIRSCPRFRKSDFAPYRSLVDIHHLTSSSDRLVMVQRDEEMREIERECGTWFNTRLSFTQGFQIYKLDMNWETTTGWVHMESLDDDEILFMGLGIQMLISSQDFIGKGNRIYFASDRLNLYCGDVEEDCLDNGVFDFEDGRFKPLDYECRVIWPSPIWFPPNPY